MAKKTSKKQKKIETKKVQEVECENCGLLVKYIDKSKEITCPNCGHVVVPEKKKPEVTQVEEEQAPASTPPKVEQAAPPTEQKEKVPEVKFTDYIPLIITTIIFIALIVIGFFSVLEKFITHFFEGLLGGSILSIFSSSNLIFFVLLILVLSYTKHVLRWIRVSELKALPEVKQKFLSKFFIFKSIAYVLTSLILMIMFYAFRINYLILSITEPLTKNVLEENQRVQFCPAFVLVLFLIIIILILREATKTTKQEIEYEMHPELKQAAQAAQVAQQPTPQATQSAAAGCGEAIAIIIFIVIVFALFFFSGIFGDLGNIFGPTYETEEGGEYIYGLEEWYLTAPRAAYESGSSYQQYGPYSSYEECQSVNNAYFYGYGTCSQ
jgi:DNA-directed RNA polymerase subunit RPC12/RpoP